MSDVSAGPATHRSAVEIARRTARVALSRGVRAAAAPARTAARLGRLDDDPRWAGVSWLWRPGWGRTCHNRLYRTASPYGIAANGYEQQKYDSIMHAAGDRRFPRVLEVGCGEGDLSERLVEITDRLLGVDISAAAIGRARARVPSATFETRMLPAETPQGEFDLIVCADVLYYWEDRTLRTGLDRLVSRLAPGGTLIAYHYRGDFSQANTADRVHELLWALVERGTVRDQLSKRMDGLGPDGAGVWFDIVVAPDGPAVP